MRMHTRLAGTIVMIFLCHPVANAIPIKEIPDGTSNTILVGKYTQGIIDFGPLSFGLAELPAEVSARFILGPVAVNPQTPGILNYGLADVMSADVSFGDAAWTALASFDLEIENGIVESLSYEFSPIISNTQTGGVVLDSPFQIKGTDTASGDAFSYTYSASTLTFRNVPVPATFALFGIGFASLVLSRGKKI